MSKLSSSDVASLKKVSKVTAEYEFYSELFLTLINQPPLKRSTPDGMSIVSYWQATMKHLFNINFMKNVKNFQYHFMSPDIFYALSSLVESNPRYNAQLAAQVNPALGNLVSWVLGIYNTIRVSRPYCLGYTDLQVLNLKQEEIAESWKLD